MHGWSGSVQKFVWVRKKMLYSEAGESEQNETWGKGDGGLLQSGGAKEEER